MASQTELLSTEVARYRAHETFDRIWREGHMTRVEAYEWLSRNLGKRPSKCHLTYMRAGELRKVRRLATGYLLTHGKQENG